MSYNEALKVAGAEVLLFKTFGTWQGDWWAKVLYQGKVRWVNGFFGSCSGCDAFMQEFGYEPECKKHYVSFQADCEECQTVLHEHQMKLSAFGKTYLNELMTQEEAERSASINLEWDFNAEELVTWLQLNAIEEGE